MWQNSSNLGESGDGEEPSGGSAAGTNFCRDLWARHPNLSSAERQLWGLTSEGKKATAQGHALNYLKGKEGRGKGAEVAGQQPRPQVRGGRGGLGWVPPAPAPREPQRRVRLSPWQGKTHGESGGMLPAASQERGKPCPQPRPSVRTSCRRCPLRRCPRPCRLPSPRRPGEARAAAVTWEYRIGTSFN